MGHFVMSWKSEVGVQLPRTQRVIRFLLQLEWSTHLCITEDTSACNSIPFTEQYCISQAIFFYRLILKRAMDDLSRLGVLILQAKFLLNFSFIKHSFEYVLWNCHKSAHALEALHVGGCPDNHNVWVTIFPCDAHCLLPMIWQCRKGVHVFYL
jgi:hypothetical protein